MHLHFTMCFSSSIICLLVVTCHGSINVYDSGLSYREDDDGSRFHDTSHISNKNFTTSNVTSSDVRLLRNSHQNDTNTDLSSHLQQKTVHKLKEPTIISKKSTLNAIRERRSLNGDFVLPFPIRNSHAGHDHSMQQAPSVMTNGHSHFHPHNTSTDEDHHSSVHSEHHGAALHPTDVIHKDDDLQGLSEDKVSHVNKKESHDGNHKLSSKKQAASESAVDATHQAHSRPCEDRHEGDEEGEDHEHDHDHEPSANYHQHYPLNDRHISGKVWLYASIAVVLISLCGLISVAVIPIMQKWFYHTLLQFLVGLAVGSLSGDGLLHLMPHAILDGEDTYDHVKGESHPHHHSDDSSAMEMKAIWKGLAALCGIFLFFIAERLLGALATYRRQKNEAKLTRHPKNMIQVRGEEGAGNGSVGEKLAQPKKNSYDHIREKDEKETIQMLQSEASPSKKGSNQSIHEIGFHGRSSFSIEPEVTVAYRPDSDSSVIVSEHHGHGHAHSHDIPQSVSAVAWMVIMGDGLHNFCDGLAIGAAFASGDADGISTTVAVFCHELPHELGDFAMLLKTGMKVKEALFYNGLSSVLCFIGMLIGVSLGNVHSATNWVFAGTAGMFLYIALVDMLPELTSPSVSPGTASMTTLLVQVIGICIGISIMLLIALYEHELHSIVS
ncbi:zinc transporter ZIP10-like [Argiope bruennichi]|uniref:zinc transporter ZIP10-like n=1 Tax=Argiope bruennichi TaxID=94029 RepID=UPI0024944F0D|nr:zinc transporter ZIP10-like [Argiope bruennichi]XP_055942122.1 zinc transporter ZIP10-like [Argiope bruennichi]XP_055942123.1 zinc transporter ZIP10-like [Argiope bruennichi]